MVRTSAYSHDVISISLFLMLAIFLISLFHPLFQVWRSVTSREYAPRAHPSMAMGVPHSNQHWLRHPNQRRNQPNFRQPRGCQLPNHRRRNQRSHKLHLPNPRQRNQHPSHMGICAANYIVERVRPEAMMMLLFYMLKAFPS